MKKTFLVSALMGFAMAASAQFNLQMHYDLGRHMNSDSEADRQLFTATAEFFKADKLGSTFLFIDMDYRGSSDNTHPGLGHYLGPIGAYWEMSRDFTFAKVKNTNSSFTAHIEYDGGLNNYLSFQQSMLVGPAWQWHNNDFSKTFTFQALYKQFFNAGDRDAHASFQTTAVWGINFAQGLCTFSGFADLWYGYKPNNDKGLIFLSEPQFWFNVIGKNRTNDKLSIGTEFEFSNNFVTPTNNASRTFYFNPTVAVKYTF